jgi:hypothetical protein
VTRVTAKSHAYVRASLMFALIIALAAFTPVIGQGQQYRMTREVRYGAVEGPNALTRVGQIIPLRDGVVITQPTEHLLRFFSLDGRFRTTIGRRGGGPGEFQHISYAGSRGDSVWVSDAQSYRVTFFGRDGSVVREFSWPPGRFAPARVLADGTLTGDIIVRQGVGAAPEKSARWPVLRFSTQGAVIDTMYFVDNRTKQITAGSLQLQNPLSDIPIGQISPDGTVAVTVERRAPQNVKEAAFTITWINTVTGDTLRQRTFGYTPLPVTSAMIENMLAPLRSSGAPDTYLKTLRSQLQTSTFIPPVTAIVVGEDNALWLMGERTQAAAVRWWHIKPDGSPGGTIELPMGSRVMAANGSLIWVLERDDLDVEYVTRYRIGA